MHWTTGQVRLKYLNEIGITFVMKKTPLLTKEELIHFVDCIPKEHELLITFLYTTGISLNQLISLKGKDLRALEGDLPESLIMRLNSISKNEGEFVFTQKNGRKHTIYSIQKILREVQQRAGLDGNCTIQVLRYSFLAYDKSHE